ncbi:protein RER1B-like [Malania oleifera]|uniref:protein RER1B-like n=1 Tax=Malania oleifera TaxID=397392 RepID=UPI0025ADE920|nr:protein RER1B-like [Malania oleifera]
MGGIRGSAPSAAVPLIQCKRNGAKLFQYYLDRTAPRSVCRWVGTLVVAAVYILRVYHLQGFYVVSYALGIFLLNLLIGFLSPLADSDLEVTKKPLLPTKGSDEFKPFIRRLSEFKFWFYVTLSFCTAFVATFFSVFDVSILWPVLLSYWIVLFILTMRHQIHHMIKYKYVPFSYGKQRYVAKKSSANSPSLGGRRHVRWPSMG